jgi:hypothetical protein
MLTVDDQNVRARKGGLDQALVGLAIQKQVPYLSATAA